MLNEDKQIGVVSEDCPSPDFLQRKKWSSSAAADLLVFVMSDSNNNTSIARFAGLEETLRFGCIYLIAVECPSQ